MSTSGNDLSLLRLRVSTRISGSKNKSKASSCRGKVNPKKCPNFGGGTESWLQLPARICSVRLEGTRILCLGREKAMEQRGLCLIRVVFMEREGKNRLGWEMREVVISGSSSVPSVPSPGGKRRFPCRAWKEERRGEKRSYPKGFSRPLGVGIRSSSRCFSSQTVP